MESPTATRQACFYSSTLTYQTEHARHFIDITDDVTAVIREAGLSNGLVVVSSQHTTAGIVVNEHEPLLLKDLDQFLHALSPQDREYHHNVVPCLPGEVPNGHAHCQALLLSSSASVPLAAGTLVLGRYQRIFLLELDHARPRRVAVTVLGS